MTSATKHLRRTSAGRGQGFTIVELLVTVGVIALLVALLVPALASMRGASHDTRCRANLRQMALALGSYLLSNDEHFPISSHTTGTVTDPAAWLQSLVPHGFEGDVRLVATIAAPCGDGLSEGLGVDRVAVGVGGLCHGLCSYLAIEDRSPVPRSIPVL